MGLTPVLSLACSGTRDTHVRVFDGGFFAVGVVVQRVRRVRREKLRPSLRTRIVIADCEEAIPELDCLKK